MTAAAEAASHHRTSTLLRELVETGLLAILVFLSVRASVQHYRVEVIDQIVTITAAGTVIAYALYTVAPRTVEIFGTDKLIYTTIFVMYGIFRYMHLMHTTESVENPSAVVTTDYPIIINVVLWITACVLLIYFKGQIPFLH